MGLFKEREKRQLDIERRTEEVSPLTIERKEVVTPATTVFKAQVTDDSGKPLIETAENKEITVEIPKSQSDLQTLSKGSSDDALTWLSRFWLRIWSKAVLLDWKVVRSK